MRVNTSMAQHTRCVHRYLVACEVNIFLLSTTNRFAWPLPREKGDVKQHATKYVLIGKCRRVVATFLELCSNQAGWAQQSNTDNRSCQSVACRGASFALKKLLSTLRNKYNKISFSDGTVRFAR